MYRMEREGWIRAESSKDAEDIRSGVLVVRICRVHVCVAKQKRVSGLKIET